MCRTLNNLTREKSNYRSLRIMQILRQRLTLDKRYFEIQQFIGPKSTVRLINTQISLCIQTDLSKSSLQNFSLFAVYVSTGSLLLMRIGKSLIRVWDAHADL